MKAFKTQICTRQGKFSMKQFYEIISLKIVPASERNVKLIKEFSITRNTNLLIKVLSKQLR